MPTFPTQGFPNPPVIHCWSWCSIGLNLSLLGGFNYPTAAAIIVQNQAYYVPFCIFDVPFIAKRMFVHNGATINGNIDLGIYDTFGNRLVSFGSVAHAGASVLQWLDITDTTLQPGQYWMAFASNSATAQFVSRTVHAQGMRGAFVLQQASAFALPNPATFATATFTSLPAFGLSSRTI